LPVQVILAKAFKRPVVISSGEIHGHDHFHTAKDGQNMAKQYIFIELGVSFSTTLFCGLSQISRGKIRTFILLCHYIYPIGSMYAIYGNMDPINIPPMLAYIPYIDPMGIYIYIQTFLSLSLISFIEGSEGFHWRLPLPCSSRHRLDLNGDGVILEEEMAAVLKKIMPETWPNIVWVHD
jgi:hypothetical protein